MKQVQEAIRQGIRKVNICTDIQVAMGEAYVKTVQSEGFRYSCQNLWGAGRSGSKRGGKKQDQVLCVNGLKKRGEKDGVGTEVPGGI